MRTVLVTGANRGIGLEFVRQYADAGDKVVAGCRSPDRAGDLQKIAAGSEGRVTVHRLDVMSDESVEGVQAELGDQPLDIVIANAGIGGPDKDGRVGDLDMAGWLDTMNTNALGAARTGNAFVGALRAGRDRKFVAITSGLGSTAESSGGWLAYRASKAALNNIVRNFAISLKGDGIVCVALSPGWVKTDMGGAGAELTPAQSVKKMRTLIDRLGPADSGRFIGSNGKDLPW